MDIATLTFEAEKGIPVEYTRSPVKKDDPIKALLYPIIIELNKSDDRVVPVASLVTPGTGNKVQNKFRSVLNELQAQIKQELHYETYFECKSVTNGMRELVGIKIRRIF